MSYQPFHNLRSYFVWITHNGRLDCSNESYFPLLYIDEDAVNDQEARINYAKNKWFISKVWLPVNHSDVFKLYNKRFGDEQQEFRPRNVQAVMSQIISNTENPGILY